MKPVLHTLPPSNHGHERPDTLPADRSILDRDALSAAMDVEKRFDCQQGSKSHWELVLHPPSSPLIKEERYCTSHDENDCRKLKTEQTVLLKNFARTPAKDSSVNQMSSNIRGKCLRQHDQLLFADKYVDLKKRLERQKRLLSTEKEAMARFRTSLCFKFFSGIQWDDRGRLKILHTAITMELSRGILATEELSRQMDLFGSEMDRLFEALQTSRMQEGP